MLNMGRILAFDYWVTCLDNFKHNFPVVKQMQGNSVCFVSISGKMISLGVE